MELAIAIGLSYLLGSIPFGLLIAKSRGIDIRAVGSGNIGATNVMREVGKSWGIITLILDALKGLIAAIVLPTLAGYAGPDWLPLACGFTAILGHSFPLYLKFKGGKGVATSAGVLIGVAPAAFGVGIGVFAVLFALFRYVSLGSIAAAIVVPVASFLFERLKVEPDYFTTYVLVVLGVIVIWRHRANIRRLLAGTENRIGGARKQIEPSRDDAVEA
ncbi:MAG: glycerol-3-phosphate 1-O-acyltransferase PlsY [Kiritimatiellia bacterium]